MGAIANDLTLRMLKTKLLWFHKLASMSIILMRSYYKAEINLKHVQNACVQHESLI